MRDTPTIASSAYASSVHDFTTDNTNWVGGNVIRSLIPTIGGQAFQNEQNWEAPYQQAQEKQNMASQVLATRRLIKIVIIDPNENIPLDQCVLYSGDEKLTDATDQELFFEIDIKQLLDAHNDKRVKVLDKKVKERSEFLEPAKIRDLKMVVVNIASF